MGSTKIRAGIVAVTAALALAACGGGGGNTATGGGGGGEGTEGGGDGTPTTISFYTDKAAWEPTFDEMNSVSSGEGLTLDFTGYSDPTAYDAFIKQAFQTNQKPDLFTWHTGDALKQLVDQGLIAETTSLWAEAESAGLVPEGLIDNYTYDGKQYCVPLNVVYWAMYYNKHVFDEHGITIPTTWDELMDASAKLKEAGVTPFHQMNFIFEFVWFQQLVMGNDPAAYEGLQTGDASYLDDSVVAAMNEWKKMGDAGYFIDPGVQTDPQTLLSTGQVAMANFGTFFTGQLTGIDQVSGEDFGIFLIPNMNPAVDKKQVVIETGPLCVGAGSANEQAALDYSAWWFTDAAQKKWSESRGDVSFNPNVPMDDPELAALIESVNQSDVQIQKRYLEATPVPIYTMETEVMGEFVTNWGDPMVALQKMQDAADAYWADNK